METIRFNLLQEIKQTLKNTVDLEQLKEYNSIKFEDYSLEEGEDPQVLFNKEGVKITIEWEHYTLYISGLTKQEQKNILTSKEKGLRAIENIYICLLENGIISFRGEDVTTEPQLRDKLLPYLKEWDISIKEYNDIIKKHNK